jgi:hypothetical protein
MVEMFPIRKLRIFSYPGLRSAGGDLGIALTID